MTALTELCPSAILRPCCTRRGPPQLAEHLAAGRAGEPVALGQLLQACSRSVHPTLTPHTARRAEHLTSTAVPAS
ncbi:hypothetical protein [Kitasatospora indigofera]|uniref:hypothetical protein n=1 Tax=Kitasatospora indigofera TaxID=67307 RepID=UPI00167EEDE6|nr:hypothetical protein [Kitasatospora indigofera]